MYIALLEVPQRLQGLCMTAKESVLRFTPAQAVKRTVEAVN